MDVAVVTEGRLGFASSCLQVDLVSHGVADRAARAEAVRESKTQIVRNTEDTAE